MSTKKNQIFINVSKSMYHIIPIMYSYYISCMYTCVFKQWIKHFVPLPQFLGSRKFCLNGNRMPLLLLILLYQYMFCLKSSTDHKHKKRWSLKFQCGSVLFWFLYRSFHVWNYVSCILGGYMYVYIYILYLFIMWNSRCALERYGDCFDWLCSIL